MATDGMEEDKVSKSGLDILLYYWIFQISTYFFCISMQTYQLRAELRGHGEVPPFCMLARLYFYLFICFVFCLINNKQTICDFLCFRHLALHLHMRRRHIILFHVCRTCAASHLRGLSAWQPHPGTRQSASGAEHRSFSCPHAPPTASPVFPPT